MARILIIDDDTFICKAIQKQLLNNGFHADIAFSGKSGLKILKNKSFDLVLCDFRLPDRDGLSMLREIKRIDTDIPVVIITAYADVRMAVKLIKQGARDYIVKPLQPEEILSLAHQVNLKADDKKRNFYIADDFMEGRSPAFSETVKYAKKVAPTDMSVLLEGETGTGKEYFARYIHHNSRRRDKPFVAVDCGAIPKELAGSELFGHIKGSFTGAVSNKTGVFRQADGGTLFLDEIGNLSYGVQVQLLRVLQEKAIMRIGENKVYSVDVRIIAASNESLAERTEQNLFREDLLHRLNEFKIIIPPLRQRKEDIPLFAEYFRKLSNKELNLGRKGFSREALEVFSRYQWPGNIRELKNVIKRSVLLASGDIINKENLPPEIISSIENKNTFQDVESSVSRSNILHNATVKTEREMIINAIEKAGYNKSEAARILDIDRKTLYNKIRKYNIDI